MYSDSKSNESNTEPSGTLSVICPTPFYVQGWRVGFRVWGVGFWV